MSWWGTSSKDDDKAKAVEMPREELNYSNAFVPDKDEVAFGNAFADDPAPAGADDTFASSTAPFSTGADSFYPTPASGAPRVNFDAMGGISAGTVAPAIGLPGVGVGLPGGVGVGLPSSGGVQYVFSDDYMDLRRKSMGEQLQYLTGAAFLGGALMGGGWGAAEGLRSAAGKTGKLRLNAALNGAAKRGLAASNGLAVVALMFTFAEAGIYHYASDERAVNYALAGAATGALYKSTRGLRAAGIAGGAGAAIALGTVWLTRRGTYGRGLQGLL